MATVAGGEDSRQLGLVQEVSCQVQDTIHVVLNVVANGDEGRGYSGSNANGVLDVQSL